MHCDVTLTAEEFKSLHNELYYLGMIHNDKVQEHVEKIRTALNGAYEQERRDFDTKSNDYDAIRRINNFRSIWSIYEVSDLHAAHPYGEVLQVAYRQHWGDQGPVFAEVKGNRWIDLYEAADRAIQLSGDEHHVYIEQFTPNKDEPRQLLLTTGS